MTDSLFNALVKILGGIEYFDGIFSSQVEPDSKPY